MRDQAGGGRRQTFGREAKGECASSVTTCEHHTCVGLTWDMGERVWSGQREGVGSGEGGCGGGTAVGSGKDKAGLWVAPTCCWCRCVVCEPHTLSETLMGVCVNPTPE